MTRASASEQAACARGAEGATVGSAQAAGRLFRAAYRQVPRGVAETVGRQVVRPMELAQPDAGKWGAQKIQLH